jgi:outer membrane lipoprotein-sorting protein
MKKLLLLLVGSLSLSILFAQDETALINAVKAKMDKVKDYKATGQMIVDVSFINAPKSAVQVYYKNPNQFKVVKDGGISILPKGGVSVNVSSLLFGSNFATVPAGTAAVKGVTTKVVKLLPLDETGDVVLTTLYIDEKALLIRKATVTTRESGSYEIHMDYGKWADWGLPDKLSFLFHTKDYKLPKGVTFEYENGRAKKAEALKNEKGSVTIVYSNYIINKGVDERLFKN